MEGIASEVDPAKRLELVAEVQGYVIDQAYGIPIFEEPQVFAAAPYINGVAFGAVGRPSFYSVSKDNATQRRLAPRARPPRRAVFIPGDTPMTHLISRLSQGALVLLTTFTSSFILVQMMPGDAVLIRFLNPEMAMTPEDIARIRVFYGSDAPILVQYVQSLLAVLSGDFGYSVQSGVPVAQEIATKLPPTLLLAGLGLLTALGWHFCWLGARFWGLCLRCGAGSDQSPR